MILKCCIIDDEPLAIELLESYVKKTPFLQLEASFTSAVQAIERISKGDIDLIFLDIQMPELDGMEFSCLHRFPESGTKSVAMVRIIVRDG